MPEPLENAPPAPETTSAEQPQTTPTEELRFAAREAGQPFEVAVLALQNLTIFPETVIPLARAPGSTV